MYLRKLSPFRRVTWLLMCAEWLHSQRSANNSHRSSESLFTIAPVSGKFASSRTVQPTTFSTSSIAKGANARRPSIGDVIQKQNDRSKAN